MTVSGIHFWIGRSDGAKHGAMKFEESVMPPIEPVGTSSAIDIYLAFADTSLLDIDSATITTPYSATISIEKDTTGGQITTQVGSQTYTNVHWDLLIKAKVTTNLDTYNLDNGYTYYTGLPIQFNLSISGTGSSTGYSTPFEIPLGPVIALHGDTPNSSNPPHTDSATLKPIAGNQCISQTRGHEWYKGSDNAIHMTSNGNVNNDTEQSHTWNVTWSFNGTNLTATSSPDSGYNRQFAYPNNANPCIKIQHPASWTTTGGSSHPSDPGAWLISILNATDPNTSQELNGSLVGTVTVTDENNSIPVYKKVHNWYHAKDTVYNVTNTMSIVKARYWTHYDSGAQFVDVTDLNDLIIAPIVPIGATKNIEIYVKHIEGTFDLDFVSPPTNGYQSIEVVQTDERGTIDGLEYNALVYVKVLYNPFNIKTAGSVSKAYFLWDDLWSNKSIPIKFRFTSTSGITINKDFTATYGLTARAYIDDDAPKSMSNMPNNSIQITALAEIADVFNNHATYGYYPVNGAENIITGEWSFSDAQT